MFRRVFKQVVGRCTSTGLVDGEGFAIDASVIKADASYASYAQRVEGSAVPPGWSDPAAATCPVRECLAALDEAAGHAGTASGEQRPDRIAAEPASAKSPSLDDSASARTSKSIRKVSFAHGANHLVDLKRTIVVDVATPARRTAEGPPPR